MLASFAAAIVPPPSKGGTLETYTNVDMDMDVDVGI
jgi:hypothetical protein